MERRRNWTLKSGRFRWELRGTAGSKLFGALFVLNSGCCYWGHGCRRLISRRFLPVHAVFVLRSAQIKQVTTAGSKIQIFSLNFPPPPVKTSNTNGRLLFLGLRPIHWRRFMLIKNFKKCWRRRPLLHVIISKKFLSIYVNNLENGRISRLFSTVQHPCKSSQLSPVTSLPSHRPRSINSTEPVRLTTALQFSVQKAGSLWITHQRKLLKLAMARILRLTKNLQKFTKKLMKFVYDIIFCFIDFQ